MFKRLKIDREYQELCAVRFAADQHISEAASMLVLAQAGVMITDEDISSIANKLSSFASERGLAPEDIQSALFHSEPALDI